VQRDPGEEIAESLLKGERENGGDDRAAGEQRLPVLLEDVGEGDAEEDEVERERDDVAQQRRRGEATAARDDDVEGERVDGPDDRDDQRDPGGEKQQRDVVAEDIADVVDPRKEPGLARQEEPQREQRGAEDQRNKETAPGGYSRGTAPARRSRMMRTMSRTPIMRWITPKPETNPRTNGLSAQSATPIEW
jgi:hypothetical protein